ncbi:NEDD4-like E3 ubiquitin-protein ligase WWP2 [Megalops cyprinoides]|uniref:NEDD4-like E3 ubiquitin-protein ligase WWP2 n=1 Tax=Megalops cyprinoides TaxID=118141 RepID=UPI001863F525|nr:NEDD4-like E3 ubiquitin-protein ligase WWP2 [Megalops cyprinoides]
MATAGVNQRPAGVAQAAEKSQLTLKVLSARPRPPQPPQPPGRSGRLSSFVEVTADGLAGESRRTAERSGGPELQWDEDLTLNVTPQSTLDLKVWSCHALRKELLGSATIDLLDTLRTHEGKMENLRLSLPLRSESRAPPGGGGGELTVCLDGLAVDPGALQGGDKLLQTDRQTSLRRTQSEETPGGASPRGRTHRHSAGGSRGGSPGGGPLTNGDAALNGDCSPGPRGRHRTSKGGHGGSPGSAGKPDPPANGVESGRSSPAQPPSSNSPSPSPRATAAATTTPPEGGGAPPPAEFGEAGGPPANQEETGSAPEPVTESLPAG